MDTNTTAENVLPWWAVSRPKARLHPDAIPEQLRELEKSARMLALLEVRKRIQEEAADPLDILDAMVEEARK